MNEVASLGPGGKGMSSATVGEVTATIAITAVIDRLQVVMQFLEKEPSMGGVGEGGMGGGMFYFPK